MGDPAYIKATHDCIILSAEKLQVVFTNYLVESSELFRLRLADMIWRTMMWKAAVVRVEIENNGNDEELRRKVLSLRILRDAYGKASR